MAKNMSKSCLKAMFAVLAAICLVLWGIGMSGSSFARAEGESPWITAYDPTHTYTAKDDEDILTYVQGVVRNRYGELQTASGVVLDKDEYALVSASAETELKIAGATDYNAIAEDLLNGKTGIAGIRGISGKAIEFYTHYVADSAYAEGTELGSLSASNQTSVKAEAKKYLEGFRLSEKRFVSSDYSFTVAETYYNDFSSVLDRYRDDDTLAESVERNKKVVEATYATYHTEDGSVNPKYPEEAVLAIDGEHSKEDVLASLDRAITKSQANEITQNYVDLFKTVKTVMTVAYEEITAAEAAGGYSVGKTDDAEVQNAAYDKAFALMKSCGKALEFYSGLPERYHDYDDNVNASEILNIYKKTAKVGVDNEKTLHVGDYGVVADQAIAGNTAIAKNMIDALDKSGKTDGVCGYRVVELFAESYTAEGALSYNGESSVVPQPKKSTVVGEWGDYRFTVTSIGTTRAVVNDFDADARLEIREGALPSIRRNLNVILGGKDLSKKISCENADALTKELAGKHVDRYFTVTVYENDLVRENFEGFYRVTIEFKSDDALAKFKDKVNVVSYSHTTITNAVALSEIEWKEGEGVMSMTYTTDNFSQFALVDNTKWTDWAFIALMIFLAIVVVIAVIAIIVSVARNWKYSVRFDATKGKGSKVLHVKLHEKFAYPKNPVRSGFVFMGWYTDKKCESRFASTELVTKGNVTVYAKWITEEEYKILKEQEAAAAAQKPAQDGDRKDRLDKLAAEKLEYETKKAEEERKAEEARLEALKQIEESKNNEEARLQAEREAEEAKAERNAVIAERDILIEKAREDERKKWLEEKQEREDSLRAEIEEARKVAEEAKLLAGNSGRFGIIDAPAERVVIDEAKIRAEIEEKIRAEEEAKKQAEEENRKFREEESARLRAEIEKELRAEEEAKKKAEEEKAEMRAELEAMLKKELDERALAEEKAQDEQASVKADLEALLKKELEEKAAAEEKARAEAEEEKRLRLEAEAKLRENEEKLRAEEEARLQAEKEEAERLAALEAAKAAEEEKYDLDRAFDLLKAEVYSYAKANDLPFSLDAVTRVCAMKQKENEIELEVNENLSDLIAKGYNVKEGEILSAKAIVNNEETFDAALDLIEDVMFTNGMKKIRKAVVTDATEETRKEGFVYEIKAERVADSVDDYYKLIRVYAKSFVLADQPEGEIAEKNLIRMFIARGKLFVYLAVENDAMMQADESLAAEGLKSLLIVNNAEECRSAIEAIGEMMKENGLVRYPTDHSVNEEGTEKGFNYVLKA